MKKLIRAVLAGAGVLAVAATANAQVVPNSLPMGEAAIPGSWTAAGPLTPSSTRWSAKISWAITSPTTGPADLKTYWYKIEHLGLPLGGTPPVQSLKSSTLDLDPAFIYDIAGVYQFGQIDDAGNAPGQSWGAESVGIGDSTIRWSWQSGLTGFNQLSAGETVYVWVQSTRHADWVNITLQNGTVGQTLVPAPAPVPEPMSMALVGMGLGVVAKLRKRNS